MSQVKPMEPRRLYQHLADRIRDLIHDGAFPPGTRLPAERDLAQQLGVSRPSLREALIALEIDGSVEIRSGSGIYVCMPEERPVRPTRSMGESPSELMDARAAIEGTARTISAPTSKQRKMRNPFIESKRGQHRRKIRRRETFSIMCATV